MRLIIAGSRSFGHYAGDTERDYVLLCKVMRDRGFNADTVTTVISSTAPGADRLGERWAIDAGIPVVRYPAKWRLGGLYNHAAGFERNAAMAEQADQLIAFWDGESNGTRNMIKIARTKGLHVIVVNIREGVIVSGTLGRRV